MKQSETNFLSSSAFSRNPFGLSNNELNILESFPNAVSVFSSKGICYIKESEVKTNGNLISRWKVIISKTSSEHAGQSDKDGKKRVLSRVEVLPPNSVCSESYLLLNVFDNEQEALNLVSYMKTRFVRFLLSTILLTQNIAKDKFAFVPLQNFTSTSDIDWSKPIAEIDQQLYAKYGLSPEEIVFIESMIKVMG